MLRGAFGAEGKTAVPAITTIDYGKCVYLLGGQYFDLAGIIGVWEKDHAKTDQ